MIHATSQVCSAEMDLNCLQVGLWKLKLQNLLMTVTLAVKEKTATELLTHILPVSLKIQGVENECVLETATTCN